MEREKEALVEELHGRIANNFSPFEERDFTGVAIDCPSDREDRDAAIDEVLQSLSLEELVHFRETLDGKHGKYHLLEWGYTTQDDGVLHDLTKRLYEKTEETEREDR